MGALPFWCVGCTGCRTVGAPRIRLRTLFLHSRSASVGRSCCRMCSAQELESCCAETTERTDCSRRTGLRFFGLATLGYHRRRLNIQEARLKIVWWLFAGRSHWWFRLHFCRLRLWLSPAASTAITPIRPGTLRPALNQWLCITIRMLATVLLLRPAVPPLHRSPVPIVLRRCSPPFSKFVIA